MTIGSGLFTKAKPAIPHLSKPGGLSGEIFDLRNDVAKVLSPLAAIAIEEFTNPATGGNADLEAAAATTVAPRTVTTFLAGGVAKLAAYPRNISFTTAGTTPADAPATATITGTYRGKAQSEVVNISQTAATVHSTKPFATVTSVAFAAADGTGATVAIGVGHGLGVSEVPKARAGAVHPVREIAVGAVVSNGTLTATGLYTPNAAPDGARDYAVFYEFDATQ